MTYLPHTQWTKISVKNMYKKITLSRKLPKEITGISQKILPVVSAGLKMCVYA